MANQIILFENANFRGAHKHVFTDEPNLNAPDDNSMNDAVSSIAVLIDQWRVFRDANFQREYDVILDSGLFRLVSDVGITNDDLSSLSTAGAQILFTGTVTIKVDNSHLPDPVTRNAPFTMLFFSDDRLLRIGSFPDVVLSNDVTAQFKGAGNGAFPSDGSLSIPDLNFHIAINIFGASDSNALFSISTGTVTSPKGKFTSTGSPADAAGNIVLVGAGAFSSGSLDGNEFIVQFNGAIAPRPA